MARQGRRIEIDGMRTDWEAIRAEYVEGDIGQRPLAARHGVSYKAVQRRSAAEGWVKAREERRRAMERGGGGAVADWARDAGASGDGGSGENGKIARRLRRKLLMRLEKVADAIPDGAVTELKAQDDSATTLFKLRDLTAAYKDLAGDMPSDEGGDVEDLGPLAELLK